LIIGIVILRISKYKKCESEYMNDELIICPNCGENIDEELYECMGCGNAICDICMHVCRKCGEFFCDACFKEHKMECN
jgi:hypothetical protein